MLELGLDMDSVLNLTFYQIDAALQKNQKLQNERYKMTAYLYRSAQADEKGFKQFINQFT